MISEVCVVEVSNMCLWAQGNGLLMPLPNLVWAAVIILGIFLILNRLNNKGDDLNGRKTRKRR